MGKERRRHSRLPLKLSIHCHRVGLSRDGLVTGRSINVSPGGMLVELKGDNLNDGELVSVEMTIPPSEDLLDFGGNFSSYARVIRSVSQKIEGDSSARIFALEFCDSPTLRF